MFLSGLRSVPSGRIAAIAEVIAPRDVRRAWARGNGASVLVLGDDALAVLDPKVIRRRCRTGACLCIGAPKHLDYATAGRWMAEGGLELVEVEDLERRVEDARLVPFRREIPRGTWAPPVAGGEPLAGEILRRIPLLEILEVACLGQAVGMERHALLGFCVTNFGIPPGELIWLYIRAYAESRTGEGATRPVVSRELGYANEANLRKAFRVRGLRLPSRGGRRALPR